MRATSGILRGGLVLGTLWMLYHLVVGGLASLGGKPSALAYALPQAGPSVFATSVAWTIVAFVAAFVVLTAAFVLFARLLRRSLDHGIASGWLAAVLAGAVAGIALDVGTVLSTFSPAAGFVASLRFSLSLTGDTATATLLALVVGWVPAVVARRDTGTSTRGRTTIDALVMLAAAATLSMTVVAQHAAGQASAREEDAVAWDSSQGAMPDPDVAGDPVPTVAPAQDGSGTCDASNTMILRGDESAATGHRVLTLTLVNTADTSCTIAGYPDVAFADQNGNLLDVAVERGDSFMTTDGGAAEVAIPAGGSSQSSIAWDANSRNDQLVASSLYAAARAGQVRGSWPVSLDIVPGSTVTVTAWGPPLPAP